MHVLTPFKALRSLRKTPLLLQDILRDVSQERAENAWDGDWNVVYMLCHLTDYEGVFVERHDLMIGHDAPQFAATDHLEWVESHRYAEQKLHATLDTYLEHRRGYIARLESLADDQWSRVGYLPDGGEATVLTVAVNAALHDIDHTEQMMRALRG